LGGYGKAGGYGKEMVNGMGNGVAEQVRGMKVRSSVKKLCEGCKVCFVMFFSLVRSGFGGAIGGT
jgi:hypothetical protein